MTTRRAFMLSVLFCIASPLAQAQAPPLRRMQNAPMPPEVLRKGPATLNKYPIGIDEMKEMEGEASFLDFRLQQYVLRRAFPNTAIDPRKRLASLAQVQAMPRQSRPSAEPDAPASGRGLGGTSWRSVGPTNINGRVTSIAIDPSDNRRVFVTTVGGIWQSTDGARRWRRVSDNFLSSVFASIAINPADGKEIFAGGGDPNYADPAGELGLIDSGIGIWRSTTGGDPGTWTKVSSPELAHQVIFRIRIDPSPPHSVYAATTAGVYVGTRQAGSLEWNRIAGFDGWTSDLVVDFSASPRKLYAGVANQVPGSQFTRGIWKFDGNTWHKRDTGIPTAAGHVIALALSLSDPKTLYAKLDRLADGRLLGVYKTTTAAEPTSGASAWANLPGAMVMDDSVFAPDPQTGVQGGYSWYNSVIEVDPTDPKRVYAGGMSVFRTKNGGSTWDGVSGGADASYPYTVHADQHAIAFDPRNPKVVFLGGDGGLSRSTDTSQGVWSWRDVSHGMILTEFFKMTTQQAGATIVAGGSQDNGTEITFGNRTWYSAFGCDGREVAIDGANSDTLYLNCNGMLHELANPVPGTAGAGTEIQWTSPPGLTPYPPITTDPARAHAALAAGADANQAHRVLLRTTDGMAWNTVSPAIPGGSRIQFVAVAPSSSFLTYYMGLSQAGQSPPTVWQTDTGGGSDGQDWNTQPNGLPTGLSPNGADVDPMDPKRAFVAWGGDSGGVVTITTNGGRNWSPLPLTGPSGPLKTPALDVVIDPFDPNGIFVATSVGVLRGSIAAGSPPSATWSSFNEGLPAGLDVNDIAVNRAAGLLYIGTMGHGAYQRDIRPHAVNPPVMLLVRDNVFDRGVIPSPSEIPDPEHPVPDASNASFYKPNDTPGGLIHWWNSTDVRIDVPDADPPANRIDFADHVEMETCPIQIADSPPGTIKDSDPAPGQAARVYVQVTNQGVRRSGQVRVVALVADATLAPPLLPADFWSATFPAHGADCGPLSGGSGWSLLDPAHPCRTIAAVDPNYPEVVRFDWRAPQSGADHSCFLVIIESEDDPIDPAVRASNERRPWVLVPNHRQIALRNLHVIDAPSAEAGTAGAAQLSLTSATPTSRPWTVTVSQAGMPAGGQVSVALPRHPAMRTSGFERSASIAPMWHAAAKNWLDLAATEAHFATSRAARLENLSVPEGQTMRLAVGYSMPPSPAAPGQPSSCFSLVAQQNGQVFGGCTYIVRRSQKAPAH